jgi:GNAT superfamily N-acetyltransferase
VTGPVAELLGQVAAGTFPPADGTVRVLPQPSARHAGVLGFTAHAVIVADVDPAWVAQHLPSGSRAAPLSTAFLSALAGRLGCRPPNVNLISVAAPLPGPPRLQLAPADGSDHPRLARARRHRDQVRAWAAGAGIVILGRGMAGRWEVAVEVDPGRRGMGLGRQLATAARHLVPPGVPVWAQVSPANAASLRAFLAAGYRPVGAEALLAPPQARPPLVTA